MSRLHAWLWRSIHRHPMRATVGLATGLYLLSRGVVLLVTPWLPADAGSPTGIGIADRGLWPLPPGQPMAAGLVQVLVGMVLMVDALWWCVGGRKRLVLWLLTVYTLGGLLMAATLDAVAGFPRSLGGVTTFGTFLAIVLLALWLCGVSEARADGVR